MKVGRYSLLIIFAVIALFPFYWMIITALSQTAWIRDPQLFPWPIYFGAIKEVLLKHPFLRWSANTFVVSISITLGILFFASLAAFSFACLRFKGRNLIFYALLSTLILPEFLLMIPRFFLVVKFGWINTYWGLIIPCWFSMFYVFLLKQYFMSIPASILDSARVDGANLWQVYWRLILPIGKPILLTLFVVSFLGHWNQFLWPVVIIRTREMQTLTLGMSGFYSTYVTEYNKIMAGSIISLFPIFIMFILFQRQIERGLRMRMKL